MVVSGEGVRLRWGRAPFVCPRSAPFHCARNGRCATVMEPTTHHGGPDELRLRHLLRHLRPRRQLHELPGRAERPQRRLPALTARPAPGRTPMTHTSITPDRDRPICTQEAAGAAGLDVAPSPAELTAMAESIVSSWGDRWAEPDDMVGSTADAGAQLARAMPLVLAEVDRLCAALDGKLEELAFLDRHTLPELRREIQHHQDGKQRWRSRAEKAEARVAELEGAPADEAVELAEGQAGLDAMRAEHPAPCRVPDSPDCTCHTLECPSCGAPADKSGYRIPEHRTGCPLGPTL